MIGTVDIGTPLKEGGKELKKNNRRLDKTFMDFLTLFHWFGWRTNYGVVVAQA